MTIGSVARVLAGLVIVVVLYGSAASAQPSPPASESTQAEAEARAHFKKGSEHFDKGEYREAYDELQKALERKKTRGVMAMAASSLKQLGRYDEALDLYEDLRREYPTVPPEFEAKVGAAIAELQGLVGTIVVAGDAPDGALLFVDERPRGKLPLAAPLRVAHGTHEIRVVKEGFEPITGTVEVQPRRESVAQLVAKSRKGRLVVSERHNWALRVELDGKDVGVTPWEGMVEPGEHRVRLHGLVGLDALAECAAPEAGAGEKLELAREGAKMASRTKAATVRPFDSTRVTLDAEEQDASLRVESVPSGAILRIDSREVGRTPWEGRLGLGEHAIEVRAGGYFAAKQEVRLVRRKERELQVVLEQEPDTAGLRKAGAGVSYGVGALGLGVFAVTGVMALNEIGDIKARCGGTRCPASEQENVSTAGTLGTVSTIGLVVGGLGVAAGTVVIVVVRPPDDERRSPPSLTGGPVWKAGVGQGRVVIEGSF